MVGTTPFTQINDTHLHASLARLLLQLENKWALEQRQAARDEGRNITPKTTRDDILRIVGGAWLSIDHAKVAEKGYKQTGPPMPLHGPVSPDDVFYDLLRVINEIDPPPTPTEIGTSLRDEAIAYVQRRLQRGQVAYVDRLP